MTRPPASLSLDLDNKWSYLKTHGDPGWERLPSYLPLVVPRVLDLLARRGLTITFFVVGQDAVCPENRPALAALGTAGHEIGNHSFHHEPWLHLYPIERLEAEIARAEEAIAEATGQRPRGFRGPGFSLSANTLEVLVRRGYRYDASTFPTFLGPLARAYYFLTARLSPQEKRERARLFGSWREGFRPLAPYRWELASGKLLEIPVTTFPLVRTPIHVSYLLYLAGFSRWAARAYWQGALAACRATGLAPSLLLHPLDFLGADDDPDLSFFPAMNQPAASKLALIDEVLAAFARHFTPVTMGQHAEHLERTVRLRDRVPRFAPAEELTLPASEPDRPSDVRSGSASPPVEAAR